MVNGYRILGTELSQINDAINKAARTYRNRAAKNYRALLGEEIAIVCDRVFLGIIDVGDSTIYDVAVNSLRQKIEMSMAGDMEDDYNFRLYVYIVEGLEGDNHTYISAYCPNNDYLSAFRHMENYSVNEAESMDMANAKTAFWQSVQKRYPYAPPMLTEMTYIPSVDEEDKEKRALRYPSVEERARRIAEDITVTEAFGRLAGDGKVEPYMMGELTRRAVSQAYDTEKGRVSTAAHLQKFQQLLPDLNEDDSIIFAPGGKINAGCDGNDDIPEEKRIFAPVTHEEHVPNTPSV